MKKISLLFLINTIALSGYSEVKHQCLFGSDGLFLKNLLVVAAAGLSNQPGAESYELTMGGILGAETVFYQFNENSSFRSGINFSLQGAKYSDSYETDPYYYGVNMLKSAQSSMNEIKGKVSLVYLNIPLFYHYQSAMGIYGQAGLQPGFRLSAKDKIDGGESYSFKEAVKAVKLGIPVELGYLVNNRISAGIRAIIGITPNIEEDDFMGGTVKSREFMLVGIVKIRLFTE